MLQQLTTYALLLLVVNRGLPECSGEDQAGSPRLECVRDNQSEQRIDCPNGQEGTKYDEQNDQYTNGNKC